MDVYLVKYRPPKNKYMNTSLTYFMLLFVFLKTLTTLAQNSPIKWDNTTYNINIDTIANKSINLDYYNNLANYTFYNNGSHVTFIDTIAYQCFDKHITKPGNRGKIIVDFSDFKYYSFNLKSKKNVILNITLPFYYENKIFKEVLSCNIAFGKSKLISYDKFIIDASERVAEIVNKDTFKDNCNINFIHNFIIKNISDKVVYCTESLVSYNDVSEFKNNEHYVKIDPGQTYKIPIHMNMCRKKKFKSYGFIEVFSENNKEIFYCEIFSNFK